ncbi:hypothetical protein D3C86_2037620 [compost metagenome]
MAQIAEQLFHYVIRNTLAHALFFRQRNKFHRTHYRPVKARPAQQGFRTHALIGFNVDNRLIVQTKLAFI